MPCINIVIIVCSGGHVRTSVHHHAVHILPRLAESGGSAHQSTGYKTVLSLLFGESYDVYSHVGEDDDDFETNFIIDRNLQVRKFSKMQYNSNLLSILTGGICNAG